MKGILVRSLFSCVLLAGVAQADTLVPANTLNEMTSPANAVGDVHIETGGRLKLSFPVGSVLSNNITNNGGVGDFSVDACTISGAISGTGEFYKAGTGVTTLSAVNTYTGPTYLDAGTLRVGVANAISKLSPVFLNANARLDLNDLQQYVGSLSGSGSVYLGSAALPAEYGLVRQGGGRLALGANSGFSEVHSSPMGGTLTIGGSTVTYGASLTMSSNSTVSYLSSGGTEVTFAGGLTEAGNASLASGLTGTLTVRGSNNIIMSNGITGSGGLVKLGTGTLTLSGSNTYTGLTIVNAGTLQVTGVGSIPNNALTQNGGVLSISGTNFYGRTLNLSGSGGALSNATSAPITVPGGITVAPGSSIHWTNVGGDADV